MIEADPHTRPYNFEIALAPSSTSAFQWTISKGGKIFQRSDRTYGSAADARKNVVKTIEKLLRERDR